MPIVFGNSPRAEPCAGTRRRNGVVPCLRHGQASSACSDLKP